MPGAATERSIASIVISSKPRSQTTVEFASFPPFPPPFPPFERGHDFGVPSGFIPQVASRTGAPASRRSRAAFIFARTARAVGP